MWIMDVHKVRMQGQLKTWKLFFLLYYESFGLKVLLFYFSCSLIQQPFLLFLLNFCTEIDHFLSQFIFVFLGSFVYLLNVFDAFINFFKAVAREFWIGDLLIVKHL